LKRNTTNRFSVEAATREQHPGSVSRFPLPVANGHSAPVLRRKASAATAGTFEAKVAVEEPVHGKPQGPLVLVADDDVMIQMLAEEALVAQGFKVIRAHNGREALGLFFEYEPDLVLCDVMMPELNGFEFCKAVRRNPRYARLPIVMLTGLNDLSSIDHAYTAGATDFSIKPINWSLLPHRVRYIMKASQAIQDLHYSEERYALAARGANDGLWDWNLEEGKIYYSTRWKSMLGYDEDRVGDLPEEWFTRVNDDDILHLRAAINDHLSNRTPHFECEYRMRCSNGEYRWMMSRSLAIFDEAGTAYRMIGSQTDIQKRKEAESKLLFDALHDSLTGLPNRALFLDRLSHSLELLKGRREYHFAVLFLDLDRFKMINDSLGHLAGDRLLIEVARRITKVLRPVDTLARLGGDEFTVLCEEVADDASVTRFAERIQQALAVPVVLDGQTLVTSASIGIVISSSNYGHSEEILRDADAAMYRAKALGGGCCQIFDPKMHQQVVSILKLESEMHMAVRREEFLLHYQPILELSSDRVAGFEALVRWQHPERGLLAPDEFISVAMETRLIVPIGQWVLREACRQLRDWQQRWQEAREWTMNVNLSSPELMEEGLVQSVREALRGANLEARYLKLEVTETALIENSERALQTMNALRDIGVQLVIDDFGTGYSSFNYLRRFPFDVLKIDQSFIQNLCANKENEDIVNTIITLAHNLGMDVVAEGSECRTTLDRLHTLPCEYAQGFSIVEPRTAEEMSIFLSRERSLE